MEDRVAEEDGDRVAEEDGDLREIESDQAGSSSSQVPLRMVETLPFS